MGRIFNSFKSQVGRDTGRVVSNLLWGDKHATPYRRVEMLKNKKIELEKHRIESEKYQLEIEKHQIEAEKEDKEQKILLEKQAKEEQAIFQLRQLVQAGISQIESQDIPSDRDSLASMLNKLILLLESHPFKLGFDEKAKINNLYSRVIYVKFTQCMLVFRQYYYMDVNINYYQKAESRFKRGYSMAQYGSKIIIVLVAILSLIFLMFLMIIG